MKNLGLLQLFCGAILGAGAACWCCSKKGKETQKDIKNAIDRHIKKAKERCAELQKEIHERIEQSLEHHHEQM